MENRLANHEQWSRQIYQQREAQFRQVANEYHAEARDVAHAEEAQAVARTTAHFQSRIGNLESQGQQAIYAVRQNVSLEARSALNAQAQQFGISTQQTIHQAQSALLRPQESYTNEIDILRNEYQNTVEQAQGNLVQSNANAELLHGRLCELE